MERDASYSDQIMNHALKLNKITQEEYNDYKSKPLKQQIGLAAGQMFNFTDDLKREQLQNEKDLQTAQIGAANSETALRGAQLNQTGPYAKSAFANTPIWADDGTGKQIQVGIHDEKGEPHMFPYGRAGAGPNTQFSPPPDITKLLNSKGLIFSPTSRNAGRWINTKGAEVDVGPDGNPILTTDGSMYKQGGEYKSITKEMVRAREDYKASQQPTPTPKPSFFDRFGGSAPLATPVPTVTPAPVVVTPAQNGAPAPPRAGEVRQGYKFKGGDPSDQNNWEKVR